MTSSNSRDLIGYGANPPDPKWPKGARLAINFVLNFEEGSEASFFDGESYSESGLMEVPGQIVDSRDLAAESMFEYGSRVGFWRITRLFQARNLPMTIFGCALALERHPPAAQAIAQEGYDVCGHGWRWVKHYELDIDEEREHIQKAVASFQNTVGSRPVGWYCRYAPSVNTRQLLVEEGGFLYDSDAYNDELPYWVEVKGNPHLVIPYTLGVNDVKFGRGLFGPGDDFFQYAKDSFDVLYREGATHPKMMSVGLHMRLMGHPGRSAGLERFLDYIMTHKDIWICRRDEIAQHWIEHHPFQNSENNTT